MTATTEIYTYLHTLALHVARPISRDRLVECDAGNPHPRWERREQARGHRGGQQHERPAIARRPDQPPERLRQSRAHPPVLIRRPAKNGSASGRDRVCQYVLVSVGAVSLRKTTKTCH